MLHFRNALGFSLFLVLASCFSCTSGGKKQENTLRVRIEAEVSGLNPYLPSPGYSRYVAALIFQTLGGLHPTSLELQPVLLTKIPTLYTVTEGPRKDLLAYDFELRPEAKWDNGSPVTANDVIFTLKTIFNPYLPTQPWRGYFENLVAIEPDTKNTKKFTAYFNKYYLLALESMCQVPIMPAYAYDGAGHLNQIELARLMDGSSAKSADSTALKAFASAYQDPKLATDPASISGSGAYRLEQLVPGEALTLVRKTNYWANGMDADLLVARPDKITYRVVKDEAAVENLLRNNEVDLGTIMNAQKFLDLQKDTELAKNYTLATQPTYQYGYWMFNLRNGILRDKAVRQAFAQLVPYDMLKNEVYQGMAERTVGPVNPGKPYYNREIKPYQLDVAAAGAGLESAGWKDSDNDGIREKVVNGKKTKLSLKIMVSGASAVSARTAESIVAEGRKAGVEFVIDKRDINEITKETRAGNFETALLAAATFPGMEDFYQLYHSNSMAPKGDNRSAYSSVAADSLMMLIRGNQDAASRAEQYKQLQAIIHSDAPHVFLFVPQMRYFAHKRFEPAMTANRPGYVEPMFQLR